MTSKCLIGMPQHQKYRKLIDECSTILPGVLTHIFNLGFNPDTGGICKTFDLNNRKPVNSDMPWWSLPETIRTCCNILSLYPDCPQSKEIVGIAAKCSNVFASKYINYNVHMMAYQTLNESGEIAAAIPATPDADPGYHTGLSLIDSIKQLQTLKQ